MLLSQVANELYNSKSSCSLGFFIAFAIKAPVWPFHTWLPDAAGVSDPQELQFYFY